MMHMLHFARARNYVLARPWRESPVTAANPKKLQFVFSVNREFFDPQEAGTGRRAPVVDDNSGSEPPAESASAADAAGDKATAAH